MKRAQGFTLIEVLIAAAILFIVLAVAGYSYRGALLASRKAEGFVALVTPLPMILASIRDDLRQHPQERRGGEALLLGVRYRYVATTVRYEPPAARFDPDLGSFTSYAPRFRLYDVRLILTRASARREYRYQELAWEPMRQ
jgi:prepilin-type N-terminal cleavage/methylation domain-containing protein